MIAAICLVVGVNVNRVQKKTDKQAANADDLKSLGIHLLYLKIRALFSALSLCVMECKPAILSFSEEKERHAIKRMREDAAEVIAKAKRAVKIESSFRTQYSSNAVIIFIPFRAEAGAGANT